MITIRGFEIEWQTAQLILEVLQVQGELGTHDVEDACAAVKDALDNEDERIEESRQGDAWEGGFAANH